MNQNTVKAVMDFVAAEGDELTFRAGEVFELLDDRDESWWKGRLNGKVGFFPRNFVVRVESIPVNNVNVGKYEPVYVNANVNNVNVAKVEEHINECVEMFKKANPAGLDGQDESLRAMENKCYSYVEMLNNRISNLTKKDNVYAGLIDRFNKSLEDYQR